MLAGGVESMLLACAQVAHARTPHVTITASATWPGDTSAQTATWDLWGFIDEAGLRVLRRPARPEAEERDPVLGTARGDDRLGWNGVPSHLLRTAGEKDKKGYEQWSHDAGMTY